MFLSTRRTATADFCAERRSLLLAGAALPLAAALPSLTRIALPIQPMTLGEAIAWLHLVAFRSPTASRHD